MPAAIEVAEGVQLVEASAGTGKTHRITDLAVLLVCERDIPIEQILIVTFTRSATAELKERVRYRLRAALQALADGSTVSDDDAFLAGLPARALASPEGAVWTGRLRRALLDFDAAAISTIHGFCQRSLGQNALTTMTEPDLGFVGDVTPALRQIAQDFWIETTWDLDRALVRRFGMKGRHAFKPGQLEAIGLERLRAPKATVRPPLTTPIVPDVVGIRADAAELLRDLRGAPGAALRSLLLSEVDRLIGHLGTDAKIDGAHTALENWLTAYEPFTKPNKPHRALTGDRMLAARRAGSKTRPKLEESELSTPIVERIDAFFASHAALSAQTTDYVQALRRRFADLVLERLDERRRQRHVQTYGDLLVDLERALTDPGTAQLVQDALRRQYRAALIDEFQDTDPVQWNIFEAVFAAGDRPLVLVGDEKQAIYSFRGADVFAFRAARKDISRTTLRVNHRSDELLVRGVNHLFGRAEPEVVEPFLDPEISFDPVDPKHPRRLSAGGPPLRLRFLGRDDPTGPPLMSAPLSREYVAIWLARDIEQLLAAGVQITDGGRRRDLGAHDIAVLVRTHLHGSAAQEALAARGIPCVRHSQDDVLRSPMARELRRLLAALLDLRNRRLVGAALATVIVGRRSDDLVSLKTDEGAWEKEIGRLQAWSATWRDGGIGAALRQAFAELDLAPRMLRRPDGARRLVDLRHLSGLLHEAERADQLRPAALLRWLEEGLAGVPAKGEEDGPENRQLRLETDRDAVRIVTVHSSKGLQYPVVFCTSLWDAKGVGAADTLRYHDGNETVLDLTTGKEKDGPEVMQARKERASEEMRLAYVALTRARHRCVVYWGGFEGVEASAMGWLLHARGGATGAEAREALNERLKNASDDDLVRELREVSAGSSESIVVEAVTSAPPPPTGTRTPPPAPPPFEPCGRRFLDTWWGTSSFTGLAGDARAPTSAAEAEQPEHEGINRDPEDEAPRPRFWEQEGVDRASSLPLAFLRPGKKAGNCLHAILEHHDFGQPEGLESRARRALAAHGFDVEQEIDGVVRGLELALSTPLPGAGVPLSAVPPSDRLNEMEFHVGLGRGPDGRSIRKAHIAAVLEEHASEALPDRYHERFGRKSFRPLSGFLKGTIDLVFRSGGRWYLADYKSSWLGFAASDYTGAPLREPMEAHDYYLQYLLYAAALHLFLEQRQAGYSFGQHFGGAYYLFLRGMTPDGPGERGVLHDPLNEGLVDGLARLLTGRATS